MGDVEITVKVEGDFDLDIDLDNWSKSWRLVVRKSPGACARCRANNDPLRVRLHKNCHCTVDLVEEH